MSAGQPFEVALVWLKDGERVARSGWNGKGMFAYYVPPASYPANRGAMANHFGAEAMVAYNGYLALYGADGRVSTWVPSSTDLLATDWQML